jgi:hypothetical protein
MVMAVSGIELNEDVDLKLQFENNELVVGDWALVQYDHTATEEVFNSATNLTDTVKIVGGKAIQTLYLKSAKRTSKQLQWCDGMAVVGGFIVFVRMFLGFFVKSINERFLFKYLNEDLYTIHKNRDYLDIKEPKPKKKAASKKSKPKPKKKEESEEEEDPDKSGAESIEEGGEALFEGGKTNSKKGDDFDDIKSN